MPEHSGRLAGMLLARSIAGPGSESITIKSRVESDREIRAICRIPVCVAALLRVVFLSMSHATACRWSYAALLFRSALLEQAAKVAGTEWEGAQTAIGCRNETAVCRNPNRALVRARWLAAARCRLFRLAMHGCTLGASVTKLQPRPQDRACSEGTGCAGRPHENPEVPGTPGPCHPALGPCAVVLRLCSGQGSGSMVR